jgi:hypothetical protein
METEIKVGSMIVQNGTPLPKVLNLQSAAYCEGWRRIKGISSTVLDQTLRTAGWNRFYIAGAMRTLELGNGKDACVKRGIARLAARAKASNFNCLQVNGIDRKSSFGISFVSFSANACHIQEGSAIRIAEPAAGSTKSRFIKSLW